MAQAAQRGLANLRVDHRDMNVFDHEAQFDRIVSVEMFEHMANWRALLARVRAWLKAGRAAVHARLHPSHRPYRFDRDDNEDWIAQHFFTGGVMPSHRLIRQFADLFAVEQEWRWSGTHYESTALDWLANFDAHASEIDAVLREVYGRDAVLDAALALFFLATAGLFGHADGSEWGVSHYRLKAA